MEGSVGCGKDEQQGAGELVGEDCERGGGAEEESGCERCEECRCAGDVGAGGIGGEGA